MRKSPTRHTLVVLRETIDFTQSQLADLCGYSRTMIQSIERGGDSGRSLKESLASKIQEETGVDAEWLLNGDPSAPIVMAGSKRPFTRESYEEHRISLADSKKSDSELGLEWFKVNGGDLLHLYGVLKKAEADNRSFAVRFRINELAEKLEADFGRDMDEEILFSDKLFRLRSIEEILLQPEGEDLRTAIIEEHDKLDRLADRQLKKLGDEAEFKDICPRLLFLLQHVIAMFPDVFERVDVGDGVKIVVKPLAQHPA